MTLDNNKNNKIHPIPPPPHTHTIKRMKHILFSNNKQGERIRRRVKSKRRRRRRRMVGWLVIALRPQTPKHIRGGWSHYTDTSEPVDGGVL
jgi:hypothetical protein